MEEDEKKTLIEALRLLDRANDLWIFDSGGRKRDQLDRDIDSFVKDHSKRRYPR